MLYPTSYLNISWTLASTSDAELLDEVALGLRRSGVYVVPLQETQSDYHGNVLLDGVDTNIPYYLDLQIRSRTKRRETISFGPIFILDEGPTLTSFDAQRSNSTHWLASFPAPSQPVWYTITVKDDVTTSWQSEEFYTTSETELFIPSRTFIHSHQAVFTLHACNAGGICAMLNTQAIDVAESQISPRGGIVWEQLIETGKATVYPKHSTFHSLQIQKTTSISCW